MKEEIPAAQTLMSSCLNSVFFPSFLAVHTNTEHILVLFWTLRNRRWQETFSVSASKMRGVKAILKTQELEKIKTNVYLETRLWSEDNFSLEKLLEAMIMHCLKQDFQQLKSCSCSSHVFWNLQARFVSGMDAFPRWPCLGRGAALHHLQESFATLAALWLKH